MFDTTKTLPAYANLIGWRQHHDTNEIEIPATLTNTDSGEYYDQKHPALRLDLIQALIPANYKLDDYLRNVVTDASNEIFNDILQYRQVNEFGKTLLEQSVLLDRYGWTKDKIVNQSRFVGMQIKVKSMTGLKMVIEQIGLQLDGAQSLTLTLFHSSKADPITTVAITTTDAGNWTWKIADLKLNAFSSELFQGGVFILGYYQDDLTTQAINYSNFDWDKGVCGSCRNSNETVWRSIRQHFRILCHLELP